MQRRRSPRVIGPAAFSVAVGGLAGFRLWQVLVGGPMQWQDSRQYEAVGSHPITSGALWAGRRPPLAPLLWKVTGSPEAFVVVQTVASIAAWTVLALAVGRLAPSRWGRFIGTMLILGFAATRPVTQWDRSVLSESLSLTALALLFAAARTQSQSPRGWRSRRSERGHLERPRLPQCDGCRRQRGARGGDVVDDQQLPSISPAGFEVRTGATSRARQSRLRRPGTALEQSGHGEAQFARNASSEELGGVETPAATVLDRGGRPRDQLGMWFDVVRLELRDHRVDQPRHRSTRVAILHARHHLAHCTFVRERRPPPIDTDGRRHGGGRTDAPAAAGADRCASSSAPEAREREQEVEHRGDGTSRL